MVLGVSLICYSLVPELDALWRGHLFSFFQYFSFLAEIRFLAYTMLKLALGVALIRRHKIATPLAAIVFCFALIVFIQGAQHINFYISRSFWQPLYFITLNVVMFGLLWRYSWVVKKHGLLH